MKILGLATFIAAVLLAGGFARQDDPRALAAIAEEGTRLIANVDSFGPVDRDRWPTAISAMHPLALYLTPAGLFIRTRSLFVEEAGFFVPARAYPVLPGSKGDPTFRAVGNGVYAYEVEG